MASPYAGTAAHHHGHAHSHSYNLPSIQTPSHNHAHSHSHDESHSHSHENGHSHAHDHDHNHSHSHNHSWTSNGDPVKESPFKGAHLQGAPYADPFTPNRANLFPYTHSPSEEQDEFNPNGLVHNAHMRTHSFVKSSSPFRATHARSGSILDVPPSPLRETHAHVTATTGASRYVDLEMLFTMKTDTSLASSWFSLPEALTGLLIPLPYLLASAAYSANGSSPSSFPPLSAYARLQQAVTGDEKLSDHITAHHASSLLQACTLTSGTLLLVGLLAKIRSEERVLDRRKSSGASLAHEGLVTVESMTKMLLSALRIGLPYYAALQLGGMRVGLVLLTALAADLTCSEKTRSPLARPATLAAMLCCLVGDVSGFTIYADSYHLVTGYLALALSIFTLHPPMPPSSFLQSSLIATPLDISTTLVAGAILSVLTFGTSLILSGAPLISPSSITFSTLSMASATAMVFYGQPSKLRTSRKAGLALGCLLTAASSFLFSPTIWPGCFVNGAFAALSYIGVHFDSPAAVHHSHDHHDHDHTQTGHAHSHHHKQGNVSMVTAFLLTRLESGSLLHSILSEKDSRRIAYFTW